MSKKLALTSTLIIVLLAIVGITVVAGQGNNAVAINQQIAGSIFGNIEVTANGGTQNVSMLNLYANGAPGAAHIKVVGSAIPAAEPSGLCPPQTDLELKFNSGGFVESFNDNSMLFYVIDPDPDARKALCVDFQGPNSGYFDYLITGGAGRFEGATGNAFVEVTNTWSVTPQLSAEEGTIQGTINLP